MSKRCELQKKYYQQKGNYKGNGKYSDDYVKWLEDQLIDECDHVSLLWINSDWKYMCLECGKTKIE